MGCARLPRKVRETHLSGVRSQESGGRRRFFPAVLYPREARRHREGEAPAEPWAGAFVGTVCIRVRPGAAATASRHRSPADQRSPAHQRSPAPQRCPGRFNSQCPALEIEAGSHHELQHVQLAADQRRQLCRERPPWRSVARKCSACRLEHHANRSKRSPSTTFRSLQRSIRRPEKHGHSVTSE